VQYASLEYTSEPKQHGFQISMSGKGNPHDNATTESFFKRLKHEEVYLYEYETLSDAETRLPYFIEQVYNIKRLHPSLIGIIHKKTLFMIKTIRKLFKMFPENSLKNRIICVYYNFWGKTDFHVSYEKNYFQFRFRNNVAFKCYDDICYELATALKGYIAIYTLRSGDSVVDCGAYVGSFTLYAATVVGETGTIIAFEPDSQNYNRLLSNIELNGLTNVVVINKGVWSENRLLRFSNDHLCTSSFMFDGVRESMTDVPVVSLDNALTEIGISNINFIKMDIEGAEIEAIKGAKKTLSNNCGLAIASYHIIDGEKTCIQLEKLLSTLGYSVITSFPEHLTTYAIARYL
jgi:FkbM family methyltransferase